MFLYYGIASPRNIHGVSYKRFLPEKNSIIPQLRSNLDSDSTMFTGIKRVNLELAMCIVFIMVLYVYVVVNIEY